tara:strand:+ start:475 stop:1158 length:684 start_codon:yes stop_codon:yes gene_type:complete
MPSRMPIVNMSIEKDVEKATGLDETEYLDKDGRVEKHNEVVEENTVVNNEPIVKVEKTKGNKVKKPKSQKQLDALARAREAKKAKAEERKKAKLKQQPQEIEEIEEEIEDEIEEVVKVSSKPRQTKRIPIPQQQPIDYDAIVNSVFSKITAKQERDEAEKRQKLEYEQRIRQDERDKIIKEYNNKQSHKIQTKQFLPNHNPSPLDPNKFLRPKTHNDTDWDLAFKPR